MLPNIGLVCQQRKPSNRLLDALKLIAPWIMIPAFLPVRKTLLTIILTTCFDCYAYFLLLFLLLLRLWGIGLGPAHRWLKHEAFQFLCNLRYIPDWLRAVEPPLQCKNKTVVQSYQCLSCGRLVPYWNQLIE